MYGGQNRLALRLRNLHLKPGVKKTASPNKAFMLLWHASLLSGGSLYSAAVSINRKTTFAGGCLCFLFSCILGVVLKHSNERCLETNKSTCFERICGAFHFIVLLYLLTGKQRLPRAVLVFLFFVYPRRRIEAQQ